MAPQSTATRLEQGPLKAPPVQHALVEGPAKIESIHHSDDGGNLPAEKVDPRGLNGPAPEAPMKPSGPQKTTDNMMQLGQQVQHLLEMRELLLQKADQYLQAAEEKRKELQRLDEVLERSTMQQGDQPKEASTISCSKSNSDKIIPNNGCDSHTPSSAPSSGATGSASPTSTASVPNEPAPQNNPPTSTPPSLPSNSNQLKNKQPPGPLSPKDLPPRKRQRTAQQVLLHMSRVQQEHQVLVGRHEQTQVEKECLLETLVMEQKISADELELNTELRELDNMLQGNQQKSMELQLELQYGSWPLPVDIQMQLINIQQQQQQQHQNQHPHSHHQQLPLPMQQQFPPIP